MATLLNSASPTSCCGSSMMTSGRARAGGPLHRRSTSSSSRPGSRVSIISGLPKAVAPRLPLAGVGRAETERDEHRRFARVIGMGERAFPVVRRLVVKVGTSSLVDSTGAASTRKLAKVVDDIAASAGGRECVLVSSGAIAAGLRPLGLKRRPSDMPSLQAAAAGGHGGLIGGDGRGFRRQGGGVGQGALDPRDLR